MSTIHGKRTKDVLNKQKTGKKTSLYRRTYTDPTE